MDNIRKVIHDMRQRLILRSCIANGEWSEIANRLEAIADADDAWNNGEDWGKDYTVTPAGRAALEGGE
jgi:hypothetical protein